MTRAMRKEIVLTYKKFEQAKREAKKNQKEKDKAMKAAKKAAAEVEKAKKKEEEKAMEAAKKAAADAKAERAKSAYDVISAMPGVAPILKDLRVYKWLCGDTTFLEGRTLKDREAAESAWGEELKQLLSTPTDASWTGPVGEYIAVALLAVAGKTVHPKKRYYHYDPTDKRTILSDGELDDYVLEVKSQTYYTTGTAGDKIPTAARKYAWVPRVSGKNVWVICLGKAEQIARTYRLFADHNAPEEDKAYQALDARFNIDYLAGTTLLTMAMSAISTPVPL